VITLPKTLTVNKTRFIVMAAAGFLLAAACFFGATSKEPGVKYVMAGFWFICGLSGVILMQPSMNFLRLDKDGMTLKSGFKAERRIRFSDIAPEGFSLSRLNAVDLVTWNYLPNAKPESIWRNVNRSVAWEDNLPGTYGGYSPTAMCELLNSIFQSRVSS
jgi:hypothetical protein